VLTGLDVADRAREAGGGSVFLLGSRPTHDHRDQFRQASAPPRAVPVRHGGAARLAEARPPTPLIADPSAAEGALGTWACMCARIEAGIPTRGAIEAVADATATVSAAPRAVVGGQRAMCFLVLALDFAAASPSSVVRATRAGCFGVCFPPPGVAN